MEQFINNLTPYLFAIIASATAYLISWFKSKELRNKVQTLDDFLSSEDFEYWVKCPKCGSEYKLTKASIIMKEGKINDNK